MPKPDFKQKQVVMYLTPEQKHALDKHCKAEGLKRSEFLRTLLAEAIEGFPDNMASAGDNLKGADNYNINN